MPPVIFVCIYLLKTQTNVGVGGVVGGRHDPRLQVCMYVCMYVWTYE
jgi:hypothetical protein